MPEIDKIKELEDLQYDYEINILGTEYKIKQTSDKKDERLIDRDGYCDVYEKVIGLETDHNWNDPHCINNIDQFYKKIKRHEIIHAFFHESGLEDYGENEQLVDWIAWQFPKILKVINDINAL